MRQDKWMNVEKLFYEISRDWFEKNSVPYESQKRSGVFSAALTIWLMLLQRLSGMPLQGALIEGLNDCGGGIFASLNKRSKKLAFGDVSTSSGGFAQARGRLKKDQISDLVKHCEQKLHSKLKKEENFYLLDGTCLTTAYSAKNEEKYPRHSVGQGKLHYPRLRLVTAHSLANGTALKPVYGQMTESEQSLTWKYLPALPTKSTVMGDRNFGVFSVVHRATSLEHQVVMRLNEAVFNRVVGKQAAENCDTAATWTPSKHDLKTTPEIPKDAKVEGRFIKYTVTTPGFRPQVLYFFTTLTASIAKIAALYLQRQRIETNISQLKQVLKLEFINAKTPDMIDKELHIAFLTFNLLSAIMAQAATRHKLPFNRISFTATVRLVMAFAAQAQQTKDPKKLALLIARLEKAMYQTKLPLRKKPRSYPRVIKRKKSKFPTQAIVQNISTTQHVTADVK